METLNSFRPFIPTLGRDVTMFIALWTVLAFVGCSKKTETGNAAESTATATTPAAESTATTSAALPPMNDANILAMLNEGDSAEIALGKLALQKTKNTKVRDFAKLMIADHGKMKTEKAELAKKLNITPQPPANDSGPSHLTNEINGLNVASAPRAFDSTYIDQAMMDHTQALALVKDFETKASAPELKDALTRAEPIVQMHLDHAKALQSGLMTTKPMAMSKKTQ